MKILCQGVGICAYTELGLCEINPIFFEEAWNCKLCVDSSLLQPLKHTPCSVFSNPLRPCIKKCIYHVYWTSMLLGDRSIHYGSDYHVPVITDFFLSIKEPSLKKYDLMFISCSGFVKRHVEFLQAKKTPPGFQCSPGSVVCSQNWPVDYTALRMLRWPSYIGYICWTPRMHSKTYHHIANSVY